MIWSLFGAQRPGDVAAVANFVILCHKRDFALPLELIADLAVVPLLVGLDRQEEVVPLLLELPKNGRRVWSASASISTPARSSSPKRHAQCRGIQRDLGNERGAHPSLGSIELLRVLASHTS